MSDTERPKDGQYFITFRTLADGQVEASWHPEVTKWLEQAQEKAISIELDRLEGFIGISDLCEADKDQMLAWIKNAKWAVVAPKGGEKENTHE